MRINRSYSKRSALMIAASLLALVIINYLDFTGNLFFDEPFLLNVFLLFIISVEVVTVLSENRILKGLVNSIALIVSGYTFYFLIIIVCIGYFGAAGGAIGKGVPILYCLMLICTIVLFFGSAINLLKLFSDWNE